MGKSHYILKHTNLLKIVLMSLKIGSNTISPNMDLNALLSDFTIYSTNFNSTFLVLKYHFLSTKNTNLFICVGMIFLEVHIFILQPFNLIFIADDLKARNTNSY